MKFEDAAEAIAPEIYVRFKEALELGKWPDGRVLTKDQKEICLQAVMLYEAKHNLSENQRTGYVDSTKKTSPCGPKDGNDDENDVSTVKILH